MAQNIIFLDIDGVVHPLNEKHLPSLVNYDELINRCMTEDDMDDIEVLNGEFCDLQMAFLLEIINATSAKIVLSSTMAPRIVSLRSKRSPKATRCFAR